MEIKTKKGFTLIELLIVIGILAILSSAVVIVLNPAQLLAQARDTQRISDLATLQNSLSYYLTTTSVTANYMASGGVGNTCGTNWWATIAGTVSPFAIANGVGNQSAQVSRVVTGLGWVPVNLGTSSGGAPLGALPSDPTNTTTYFYAYSCNEAGKTFKLASHMESTIYKNGGTKDVESKDGGTNADFYEAGNSMTL